MNRSGKTRDFAPITVLTGPDTVPAKRSAFIGSRVMGKDPS